MHDCAKSLDNDVETAYDQFAKAYSAASSVAIPSRTTRPCLRPSPKWFNPPIKLLTKRKFKLHCLVRSAPYCSDLNFLYAESCKKVKNAVRSAIRKFDLSIIRVSKREPKLLFNYINSQRGCRDSIKGLTDSEGVFHTDGAKIVNLLNDQFGNVFIPRLPCSAQIGVQPPTCSQLRSLFARKYPKVHRASELKEISWHGRCSSPRREKLRQLVRRDLQQNLPQLIHIW